MINPRSNQKIKIKIKKVDPSDLESDRYEIGTWLNLRACCIVDGGRSLDCLTS